MFNLENFGISTGRLTADPQIYTNGDGSKKVRITLAASNGYKNRDGSRGAQFVPLEAFIPAHRAEIGLGVYGMIHKGDKITAEYEVKSNNYTDNTGRAVYGIALQIDSIRLLESRAVTSARRTANTAETATKSPRGRRKAA